MNMRAVLSGLLCVLGSAACFAEDEPLVAVVDLEFIKETELVTSYLCMGDANDECFPWSNGYLFEARLRRTISGTAAGKKFLVVYGRHALGKADIRGVTGKFSKLENGVDGAQYQLVRRAVEGQACFEWWGRDGDGPAEQPRFGALLHCFDAGNPRDPLPKDSPHYDPQQSLRAANDAYNQAIIAGDTAALDRIFAQEFIYTTTSGEVLDKAAQLLQFKSGRLDIESGTGADEQIQIHGKTGIVTGRFDARGKYAGKPFEASERYTSVWIIRDDRWQLLAEQGTLRAPRP
jgi:ketosteroid isomerase-like protein